MPRFIDIDSTLSTEAAADARLSLGITGIYPTEADTTGVADSLAVLQGIIDDASAGDTIILPGGTFKISAPLVIDKPLVIRGGGGMFTAADQGGTYPGAAGTTIVTTSATANGLNVTASGVVLEDFAVVNTRSLASPPTGGTGIFMHNANNFRLSRMTVAGFYDCVRCEGRFGTMDACNILDPVHYGIYLLNDNTTAWGREMDFGDQGISNCVIAMYGRKTTDAEAAVRWESGGGIRFTGNKIVAGTGPGAENIAYFKYGIDIVAENGYASGEFMITGGGISTCNVACIRAVQAGEAGFTDITVTGVVIQGRGGTTKGIIVGAGNPNDKNNIRNVIITGNTFKGTDGGGIIAYNMRGLVIGPNVWASADYTAPLIKLAGSPDNGISTQQVDIYRQTVCSSVQDIDLTIIEDNRGIANQGSLDGFVTYNYKRNVIIDSAGWKTLFTIEPPSQGGGGFIDVTYSGQTYRYGVNFWLSKRIRRGFARKPSPATLIVETIGADELVSTLGNYEDEGDVEMRVADGGSGKLLVQMSLRDGNPTTWGDIEVNVTGRVQRFSYGVGV